MTREVIFNTFITVGTYKQFIQEIADLAARHRSSYVCFANVHMLIEAHRDSAFNTILNEANVVAPDGKPLSVFLNVIKGVKQERVCGMDMLPDLLHEASQRGLSIFFYGTTPDVLNRIVQRAGIDFPSLKISGTYSPPFRELLPQEKDNIIRMINHHQPDLLMVSLGCPKQEKWMAEHKGKLNCCMLGLGQAFHVYAGIEKRLPRWMRNLSLEWVYRLFLEPRRLWKRYLYGNSMFLFLTIRYVFIRWLSSIEQMMKHFVSRHPGEGV